MSVIIADITKEKINPEELTKLVLSNNYGADVTFVGRVRDHDEKKKVTKLIYEAHPSATDQIRQLSEIIAKLFPEVNLAVLHRVGELSVGDIAFIVSVASAHRDEALNACRALVETVKANAPIWKHQFFQDGTDEWVNSP
jgi:molybdopterin synthase catalytic subunit